MSKVILTPPKENVFRDYAFGMDTVVSKPVKSPPPPPPSPAPRHRTARWVDTCTSYEYIQHFTLASGKTHKQIAREVGLGSTAAFGRLTLPKDKSGMAVPPDKIWRVAEAINCDPVRLRDKVFRERWPEYFRGERVYMGTTNLNLKETEVIDIMRGMDVNSERLTDAQRHELVALLAKWKKEK